MGVHPFFHAFIIGIGENVKSLDTLQFNEELQTVKVEPRGSHDASHDTRPFNIH